jgi:DNA-binding beta-propeller fold protein YncE
MGAVVGLIPTGYYPNSVSLSEDGTYAYVADGKGVTGPNPGETYFNTQPNQYVEQLQKSYLHSFPIPSKGELAKLTKQVAINNHYGSTLYSGSGGNYQLPSDAHQACDLSGKRESNL